MVPRPIEGSVFVVQGRTILDVGRAGEVDVPAGAARVDLTGKTVMPAIVDPHSHVGYYDEVTDTEIQDDFTLERILDHLDRFAYTGHALTYSLGSDMPTFIDARYSDDPKSFIDLRDASEEDSFTGARYFTVGRGLAWPGTGNPRSTSFYPAVSPWVAEAAVRELAAQRVTLIEEALDRTPMGVDDPRSEEPAYMPGSIYEAAIAEAHRLGVRTIAHVKTVRDWKGVIRAGVDADDAHGRGSARRRRAARDADQGAAGLRERPALTSELQGGSAPRAPGQRPEWLVESLFTALQCRVFLEEWGRSFEPESQRRATAVSGRRTPSGFARPALRCSWGATMPAVGARWMGRPHGDGGVRKLGRADGE